jgi:hypothetical protein
MFLTLDLLLYLFYFILFSKTPVYILQKFYGSNSLGVLKCVHKKVSQTCRK